MKIAIEAQRIFRKNKHGMDFVVLEVVRELQRIDKENEYFIFVSPGDDKCLEESDNVRIIELSCPTYPLWEQVALPRAVAKLKPDLLHCTSNTAPLFCKVPIILTLHDIIFLEKKQGRSGSLYQEMGWYYRKFVVPCILPKCRKIITVSDFERRRIKECLRLSDEQLIYIYNGFSSRFKPLDDTFLVTKKYIPSEEYLFFLGNTDPKKNVARTLKAYSIYLNNSDKKLALLVADLTENHLDAILKSEGIEDIKSKIYYPGYISHSDLPMVYSGAYAFLYTSLRESFGIPLLESMASGTPVITSNTSAMPEIAGEGAIFSNPMDANSISDKLLQLEKDREFYKQQVAYGLERVKSFSWRKTAEELLKLYLGIK